MPIEQKQNQLDRNICRKFMCAKNGRIGDKKKSFSSNFKKTNGYM